MARKDAKPKLAALKRSVLVRLVNSTAVAARWRAEGHADAVTTQNTLAKWLEAGCPANADGTLSLIEVLAWLALCRKEGRAGDSSAARDLRRRQAESRMDKDSAAAEVARLRARREAMDLAEAEGKVIPVATHKAALAAFARAFVASLERVESFAPRLAGCNPVEIREILRAEFARLRIALLQEKDLRAPKNS